MTDFEQGKALFNIQRFMILQTKMNPQTDHKIPNEYAYAWYVKLYPLLNDGEWHENFESYFEIKKENVDKISKFLDDEWVKRKYYTFYEIEDHFKYHDKENNIDRNDLLCVLRYLYLRGGFDEIFWKKILEPTNHPVEASMITSEFNSDDLYFV